MIFRGIKSLVIAGFLFALWASNGKDLWAQSYNLFPVLDRVSPGNFMDVTLFVQNVGGPAFSFGPTNLQFSIPGAPIDYTGITFINQGPFDDDAYPLSYRNITVGGSGVVTVTIQKQPVGVPPLPGDSAYVGVGRTVRICRLRLPLLACTGTFTWQWNPSVGVITNYLVQNIKPNFNFSQPIPFPLDLEFQNAPNSICINGTPPPPSSYPIFIPLLQNPTSLAVISNIGSSITNVTYSGFGTSFSYVPGTTTVQDTDIIVVSLGACNYSHRIIVDGRSPQIIVPAAISRDSLCGAQTYTVQADQPGNWLYRANSGSTLLSPNLNATAVTIQITPGPTPQVDTLIVSSPGSCPSAGDTLLLYISPAATILGPRQRFICQGQNVSLTSSMMGDFEVFQNGNLWFSAPATNTLVYTASTPGIDTVVFTVNQCKDTVFVVVDAVIAPVVSGPLNTFAAPFQNVYQVLNPSLGYAYSWTLDPGIVVDSISADSTYIRVLFATPGNYNLTLTVTKNTAPFCGLSTSFIVNASPFNCAQVDFVNGDTAVCVGSATALYLETFVADTLQWQIFNGVVWQNVTGGFGANGQVYLTPIFPSAGTFRYRVIGAVPFCRDTSPELVVRVTNAPVGGVPAVPSLVECADSATFVSVLGGSGRIQWQESVDGFTWANTSPVDTLNVLILPPLGASRFYRARFTTLCDTTFANPTFVQRVPVPSGGVLFANPATICPGDVAGPLGASALNGSGRWEKVGGFGGFSNSNDPNASYISVSADAGSIITLNWIISNNTCTPETIPVTLFVTPNPAGTFATNIPAICRLDSTIPLNATVTQGVGRWASNGAGSFIPNDTDPNARYASVLADEDRFIDIYWIIQVGGCTPDTLMRTVYVGRTPLGNFSVAPTSVCINTFTAPLGASLTFGTGSWTTSGNGFFDQPNNPNSRYFASEVGEGPVDLNWVVSSGGCLPEVYKQVLFVSDSSAGVFNTPLAPICAGSSTPPLGALAIRGIGRWSTSNGQGYFNPDSLNPNAVYISDTNDAGKLINLIWTVQNGVCAADVDSVKVQVLTAKVSGSFPGVLSDICQNSQTPPLGAIVTAGVGQWNTPDGTGSFIPNINDPNAVYRPGGGDIDKTVTLQWVVTNGSCNQLVISKSIYIWATPTAIWNRTFVDRCVGDSTNFLGATAILGRGKYFTPNGSGYFSPNDSTPLARYIISPADADKNIALQFITRNGPVCVPDTQTRILRVNNFPAGDFNTVLDTICAGSVTPSLGATVSSGIGRWVVVNCDGDIGGVANPINNPNARFNSAPSDAGKICTLLWIVEAGGCVSDTNSQTVFVNTTQVVGNFSNDLDPVCYVGDTSEVLAATVSVGTAVWTSSGSGTFVPNNTDPNARYVPGPADRGTTVAINWTISNASCNSVTFSRNLVVQDSAAGRILSSTNTYCFNSSSDPIVAVADNGVGFWRIVSGSGGLSPNNTATTVIYTPGLGDQDATVRLEWITTTNPCKSDTDTISLYYFRPPSGSFNTIIPAVCAGAPTIPLGAILSSGVGTWSSTGAGTFTNLNDPNASYIADTLDAGQTVFLTWTVVNGLCTPDVEVRPVQVLNSIIIAGWTSPVDTVCFSDGNTGPLNASLVQGDGRWSVVQGSGFFNDILDPNSTYIFGPLDQGRNIILSWNVTTAGCDTVRYLDTFRVREVPLGAFPTVLTNICVTDTSDTLVGISFGNGTYGFWDCVNCNGTFTFRDSSFTRYIPDSLDAGQNVTIRWNVTKNFCDTTRYAKTLRINRLPAGTFNNPIADICAGQQTVPLGATASVGVGSWSCLNCNGGFTNSLNPNARYISVLEDSGKTVTLVWTIFNGACDTLRLTQDIDILHPSRGGFPFPPQSVCSNTPTTPLSAFVVHGVGTWVNTPFGTFANPNSPNTTFTPVFVPRDTAIALTWQVQNGVCSPVDYSRFFTIIAPPRGAIIQGIPANLDTICARDSTVQLVAVDSNGVGQWITPNGQGSFANPNSSVTRYRASLNDANKWIYLERRIIVANPLFNCPDLVVRDSVYVTPIFPFRVTIDNPNNTLEKFKEICQGESVSITATGGNVYSWFTDNQTNNSIIANSTLNDTNKIIVRPSSFGNITRYIVRIRNNSEACEVLDTITIDTKALQAINATNNAGATVCDGDPIQLNVTGPLQPGGPIIWSPGLNLSDSTIANPILTARGSFTPLSYRVRALTLNGCFSESSVNIFVDSTVKPTIQPVYNFCVNSLGVVQLGEDWRLCDSVEWYRGTVAQVVSRSNGGNDWGPAHPDYITGAKQAELYFNYPQDTSSEPITYRCVRTGRCNGLDETVVNIRPLPQGTIEVLDRIPNPNGGYTTAYKDRTFKFKLNTTVPNYNVTWVFGDTLSPNNAQSSPFDTITFTYTRSGKFSVAIILQDVQFGCINYGIFTDFITIRDEEFYFPSAFSPNNDGLNDTFRALPLDENPRVLYYYIYNRNGQVVYNSQAAPEVFTAFNNPTTRDTVFEPQFYAKPWEGRDNSGNPLDPGPYTYKAVIIVSRRNSLTDNVAVVNATEFTGLIQLIR